MSAEQCLEGSVDAVVQAQPALTFNKEEVRPKGDLAGALAKELGVGVALAGQVVQQTSGFSN